MTENLTSDSSKLTPTTTRSKASSTLETGAKAAPDETPTIDLTSLLPGFVARRAGAPAAVAAIDAARQAASLPSLNATDYRFTVGRPGGIPASLPVTVIYKAESPEQVELGTFRVRL